MRLIKQRYSSKNNKSGNYCNSKSRLNAFYSVKQVSDLKNGIQFGKLGKNKK